MEPQSNFLKTLSILTSLKVIGKFFFSLKTKEGAMTKTIGKTDTLTTLAPAGLSLAHEGSAQ